MSVTRCSEWRSLLCIYLCYIYPTGMRPILNDQDSQQSGRTEKTKAKVCNKWKAKMSYQYTTNLASQTLQKYLGVKTENHSASLVHQFAVVQLDDSFIKNPPNRRKGKKEKERRETGKNRVETKKRGGRGEEDHLTVMIRQTGLRGRKGQSAVLPSFPIFGVSIPHLVKQKLRSSTPH